LPRLRPRLLRGQSPPSPDLNLLRGVWALLKCRINGRRPRPTTYEDIKEALIDEWDSLSPEDYEAMIISMPERVRHVDCTRRFVKVPLGRSQAPKLP
jgi:hypothetical protein